MGVRGGRKQKKRTTAKKRSKTGSHLESEMLMQMKLIKLPEPKREYRFHPVRRWRFDFAFPNLMVALEVEGGIYGRGRHTSVKGYTQDAIKYSTAAIMGWMVIRVTAPMIKSGEALTLIEDALKAAEARVA